MNSLVEIVGNHLLTAAVRMSHPRLLPMGGGVVAAVSGGPDSVAMLSAMHVVGVTPLIVAHINHQLRDKESDDDAKFVETLSNRLGLPFRSALAPLPACAGIEATARRLRYDKLRDIANEANISTIATGHTLNDHAETIVMRLLRGTGLAGLGGIPRTRRWQGMRIIRPLLTVHRETVLHFLETAELEYRTDSSNVNPAFTRNRIRNQVMPLLRDIAQSGLDRRLSMLAMEARRLHKKHVQQANEDIRVCELLIDGPLTVFLLEKLAALPGDRISELWRAVWRRENWPDGEMTRRHWHRLVDVCRGRIAAVDCPGGIRVRRLERVVRAGPGA